MSGPLGDSSSGWFTVAPGGAGTLSLVSNGSPVSRIQCASRSRMFTRTSAIAGSSARLLVSNGSNTKSNSSSCSRGCSSARPSRVPAGIASPRCRRCSAAPAGSAVIAADVFVTPGAHAPHRFVGGVVIALREDLVVDCGSAREQRAQRCSLHELRNFDPRHVVDRWCQVREADKLLHHQPTKKPAGTAHDQIDPGAMIEQVHLTHRGYRSSPNAIKPHPRRGIPQTSQQMRHPAGEGLPDVDSLVTE